ncbi:hypothetical protein HOLleu_22257 [Holothuria leucospilota]|uniref:WW domain-containing protein n=1 Tax=Holothuria leucospilota TaxID=206669 RepID=A0A9Q1BYB9_HOLLE|nr:hypothetical protein HOLleu_22257 [Holothuria leucospilota]
MASKIATPCYCIQHSRFTKQDGWRLWDLSLSLNGNIAVTGGNENTYRTCIDVYTNVRHSNSRDKPKIIYSKEFDVFEDEAYEYYGRLVSFYPGSGTIILSGLGDKLEVIDIIQDRVIKCRKIKLVKHGDLFGEINCLSVRETEIFIGFRNKSNKITIYDVIDLNEIKSISLQGIQDGYWPGDVAAVDDRIFVCVGDGKEGSNEKALVVEEKNGRILSQLTKPSGAVKWFVESLALNITLNVIAVAWSQTQEGESKGIDVIVFYSLLSENKCSFLIAEVEFGVIRIRISDRGHRMITGNHRTGEVKEYDMAEIFTYSLFKEKLESNLKTDECTKLANFFKIPRNQTDAILGSETPSENLLLSLEQKNILQPRDVSKLIEAFDKLRINPFCRHVAEIFRKTRAPSYYKGITKKQREEMKTLQMTSEEDGKVLKAPWTLHKTPDGRVYYHNPVTKELRWENPETGQRAESQDECEGLYLNLSLNSSEFLQESSFEGEFGKFSVRVSEKLTKANCVKLATYFNFPAAKIDQIRNDSETPGITLLDILKERRIVNILNVVSLKEALEELELKDISDTLVTPYQMRIDRLRFEQQYLSE